LPTEPRKAGTGEASMSVWSFFGNVWAVLFLAGLMFSYVQLHERTHATIYKELGAKDIKISYSYLGFAGFTTANTSGLSSERQNVIDLAQANVEATQYPLMLITLLLGLIYVALLRNGRAT
jgi:hypothetical protein